MYSTNNTSGGRHDRSPHSFRCQPGFRGHRGQTVENTKRAADVGFDVVMVGDHHGAPAPMPTWSPSPRRCPPSGSAIWSSMRRSTSRRCWPAIWPRWTPPAAGASRSAGQRVYRGRLRRFWTAVPSPRQRVEVLTEHVTTIRNLLSSPDYRPAPVQSPPPIMVAGIGDKMLSMAAQHADIIAIAAQGHQDQLGERVDYIKSQAGPRFERSSSRSASSSCLSTRHRT